MPELFMLEGEIRREGYPVLCGVDEAGRGPLAGPVCAAAVILPPDAVLEGLDDSKRLTERRREALYDVICDTAVAWAVAWASHREIDDLNILGATYLAMNRAMEALGPEFDLALIDGNRNEGITFPSRCVVGGDGKCQSIAAASVLAKVSRDQLMAALAEEYPQYGFDRHKGYPTKAHYAKLNEYGVSPVHRRSFLKKWHREAGRDAG